MSDALVFILFGLTYTGLGVATMNRPDRLRSWLVQFSEKGSWLFLTSMLAFMLGILLIFTYGAMAPGWLVILSAVGWLALAKGFLILSAPYAFHRLMRPILDSDAALTACSMACYIFGALMIIVSVFV